MTTAPVPKHPPGRWIGLILSRKFWVAVGAVVVALLAVYALVAIPVGPTPFHFKFSVSNCKCQHTVSVNHTLPGHAYIVMQFTSHYIGGPAEYILIVTDPTGVELVYAVMEGGSLGVVNYANVTETFNTNTGGAFNFTLLGTEPVLLPGVTAWVNGTYNAPALS